MTEQDQHETDIHNLSLGVINALELLDMNVLSYAQLRRLYAALTHTKEVVVREIAFRSEYDEHGDPLPVEVPATD